jgi:transcriptional regulator with GAF, ATPase, and Fis domain
LAVHVAGKLFRLPRRLDGMFHDGIEKKDEAAALTRIVGESDEIRALKHQMRLVAPLASTVLLTGETGTGKGRVARVLHDLSNRSERPFVHVDCAALSSALIESELFGHERGSFTNAAERHTGRFELAGEGTVFLDEVGDLEPRLQSKLLRVLDDREFERIGGTQTLRMRARVMAATSRDLRRAVEQQRFRADLYFRLNVFQLSMPALRDRSSDIPPLVADGLSRLSRRLGLPRPQPTDGLLARLMSHSWPGNIRELMNVLECLVVHKPGERLKSSDLDGFIEEWNEGWTQTDGANRPGGRELPQLVEEMGEHQRREIIEALERSGGNVTGAARRLRVARSTLRHRIKKHNLK